MSLRCVHLFAPHQLDNRVTRRNSPPPGERGRASHGMRVPGGLLLGWWLLLCGLAVPCHCLSPNLRPTAPRADLPETSFWHVAQYQSCVLMVGSLSLSGLTCPFSLSLPLPRNPDAHTIPDTEMRAGRHGATAGGVLGTQLIKDRGMFCPPCPSPHAGCCPSDRRLAWFRQATGSEYLGLKVFGCVWCIFAVLELLRTTYWAREGSCGLVGSCW